MTHEQKSTFRAALREARASFDKATSRRTDVTLELQQLNDEIGKLRKTITALAAMCSENPGFDDLGITDACMEVMASTPYTQTTIGVVSALENMGFDLKSHKNPSASVHAILSRLAKNEKITKIEGDDDKVYWRGPSYDPILDAEDIPF